MGQLEQVQRHQFIALLSSVQRSASTDLAYKTAVGDIAKLVVFATPTNVDQFAASAGTVIDDSGQNLEARSQYDADKLAVYAEDVLARAGKAIDER